MKPITRKQIQESLRREQRNKELSGTHVQKKGITFHHTDCNLALSREAASRTTGVKITREHLSPEGHNVTLLCNKEYQRREYFEEYRFQSTPGSNETIYLDRELVERNRPIMGGA